MIGWKELKLGKIAKVISGYAFKSTDFLKENGIPVIKIKNIKNGDIDLNECDYVSLSFLSLNEKYHLKRNDILVSLTGSHITQPNSVVGRIALYRNNLTSLLNQRAGKILPDTNLVDRLFLYAYLSQSSVKEAIASKARGAANQANISPGDVEDTDILLPSLPIQHRISSILSAYDHLIKNNLKRIKLLEELAQRTYEEYFVKFRINDEQLDVNADTGLPDGWEKKKFKETLIFKTGKLDSNAMVPGGQYDFYTCAKEIFKTNSYRFEGEAVLLGGNNATGDFALFYANSKFDAYQRTYIVTSQHNSIPLEYVYYVLKKYLPHFQNISSGAATKFLTMRILDVTDIVIPPNLIFEQFNKVAKPCFEIIINLQNQNHLLKESRDILLPRLMNGKIEVVGLVGQELEIAAEPVTLYKSR